MQHFLPEVTAFSFAMCAETMSDGFSRVKDGWKPWVSTGVFAYFFRSWKKYAAGDRTRLQ